MTLLQSVEIEHLPAEHTIHIALFKDVENAALLHQQLLAGNTDFEYGLIDASVVSFRLVLASAFFFLISITFNIEVVNDHHVLTRIFPDCLQTPCTSSSLSSGK
jgi:hypothetical protein